MAAVARSTSAALTRDASTARSSGCLSPNGPTGPCARRPSGSAPPRCCRTTSPPSTRTPTGRISHSRFWHERPGPAERASRLPSRRYLRRRGCWRRSGRACVDAEVDVRRCRSRPCPWRRREMMSSNTPAVATRETASRRRAIAPAEALPQGARTFLRRPHRGGPQRDLGQLSIITWPTTGASPRVGFAPIRGATRCCGRPPARSVPGSRWAVVAALGVLRWALTRWRHNRRRDYAAV